LHAVIHIRPPSPSIAGTYQHEQLDMNAHRLRLLPLLLILLLASGVAAADADPRLRERLMPFLPATPVVPVAPMDDESTTAAAGETTSSQIEPPVVEPDPSLFSPRLLAELYDHRKFALSWTDPQLHELFALATASRDDGFDPADFRADELESLINAGGLAALTGSERADADLLLSDALLRYVHHFRFGKYDPKRIRGAQAFTPAIDAEQLRADIDATLDAPDLSDHLAKTISQPFFYRNLKRAYQRYRKLLDDGGTAPIPAGTNLETGMRDPRVPLIRTRLARLDDWRGTSAADPEQYDEAIAEAVREFQRRSGLTADGVVGPRTLAALNKSIDKDGLALIRANLERMRWLYDRLGDDFVFVDVTAFHLGLYRDNELEWSTRVVVGTRKDQTPMFRDEMEYVVFNPTWSVPVSIQKTMGRVGSKYQVVDRRTGRRVSGVNSSDYRRYRIVQPAGPGNALGRVKFIFPNNHAVYLHDTPSKHLFAHSERAYSHGCIRVKDPLDLADHVLDTPNWDQAEVNRVVNRGRTRYVHLDDHLQVLIYYLTAMADADGRVGFRHDIYGRDATLLKVMQGPASPPRLVWPEPEAEDDPAAETAPEATSEPAPTTPSPSATPEPTLRSAEALDAPSDQASAPEAVEGTDNPADTPDAIADGTPQPPEPAANIAEREPKPAPPSADPGPQPSATVDTQRTHPAQPSGDAEQPREPLAAVTEEAAEPPELPASTPAAAPSETQSGQVAVKATPDPASLPAPRPSLLAANGDVKPKAARKAPEDPLLELFPVSPGMPAEPADD
jgi:murein L,D-transpeptidase YcbB/YkuD